MSRVTELHETTIALSDLVPIDERISWHRPGLRGYEPYNEYLIDGGDRALLIDGGVGLHVDSIITTLRELLRGRQLYLYATRIELECIGNFGRLIEAFPEARLLTANVVPLPALFHMPDFTATRAPWRKMAMGDTLAELGFPHIKIHQAPVRMLGTSWLWDQRSRILYTTDYFNTDMLRNEKESVLRSTGEDFPQAHDIYDTLLRKFDWLPFADMTIPERDWNNIFSAIEPVAIAPIHGRVYFGRDIARTAVESHRQASFGFNAQYSGRYRIKEAPA
jgi:flavorubredoxin